MTMFPSSPLTIAGSWLVTTLIGVALGIVIQEYRQRRDGVKEELDEELSADGGVSTLSVPDVKITLIDWWKAAKYLKKQKLAAKKGYVKWIRIGGSNWQAPKWVKPEFQGSGEPKATDEDGKPYYFTEDAMLTDAQTGAPVCVHIDGESDPINLSDRAYPGIEADLVERLMNLEAENDPPGFFDGLDMSFQTMVWLGIALLFVLFAASRMMGGA